MDGAGIASATTISNKSTSAGTGNMGLWKGSSKLMRDPDAIGNQMMMNSKQGNLNSSSGIFGSGLMVNNSSAFRGVGQGKNQIMTHPSGTNLSNGLGNTVSNFSPSKTNSESVFLNINSGGQVGINNGGVISSYNENLRGN